MLETIYAVCMTLQNLGVLPWLVSRRVTLPEADAPQVSSSETLQEVIEAQRFGVGSYL